MDEQKWLSCNEPTIMLDYLRSNGQTSARKLRLFACYCFRRLIPHRIPNKVLQAVEFAELFADGAMSTAGLARARDAAVEDLDKYGFTASAVFEAFSCVMAPDGIEVSRTVDNVLEAMESMGDGEEKIKAERTEISQVIRDMHGNPFHEIVLNPASRNETIVKLAEAVYNERTMPEGIFDPQRLMMLVHAFQEAGFEDQNVLGHLHHLDYMHVRGCFVVDAILSKE